MNLTADQLETLRHMLGINTPYDREPRPYRDYYCAGPGNKDMVELERLGVVERLPTDPELPTDYEWFRCTAAGHAAAIASHRAIRKRKSARVYRAWLKLRDAGDVTFHEFLTDPDYAQVRRES